MARRRGAWLRFAALVLKPLLTVFTHRTWSGRENVPAGPVIMVVNHLSYADPPIVGHFVYDLPREPRFLGKDSVFELPLVGAVLRGAGQIPVHRETTEAVKSLDAAIEALERGECVVIYPEGTCTRDPDLWPMRGKTGAARLAMLTGAPVVPLAQWGAQRFHHPITRKIRLRPRTPVTVMAGEPIDLSAYIGRPATGVMLAEITELLMHRIRDMVAEIRGVPAPAGPLRDRPARPMTPEVPS